MSASPKPQPIRLDRLLPYLILGTIFGFTLVRSEVISWFRIQEMFRFQGFHMYGIIATAVLVAGVSIWLIRGRGTRTIGGDPIEVPPKALGSGRRYWMGGIVFGLGWSIVGSCPGPIVALIGAGTLVFVVTLVGALFGTWLYGNLRPRLPH
jgi:uncharacterized membrane protein YedE/YeeE